MNKAILVGALGQDPEVKVTESGKSMARVTLATNNGKDKPPTWHKLVFWNKNAEFASTYLKKGTSIAVDGRIDNRVYEKDGQKRTISEVIVDRVEFAGNKRDNTGGSKLAEEHGVKNHAPTFEVNEEIPF